MEETLNYFSELKIREKKKFLKVGVIAGGISSEREISLKTGMEIYKSLLNSGYRAFFIDLKDDFCKKLEAIDLAFLALHGKYGEDGTVQGLLELLKIPYTGSGVLASALAMDKIFSKKIFIHNHIPTPGYIKVNSSDGADLSGIISRVKNKFSFPVIVKPNKEGSTIGVSIIENGAQLADGIKMALNYDSKVLIEKFIEGKQLTVSVIGRDPVALPIIEIKPKSGFYDYKSKYTKGLTEYVVPAHIERDICEYVTDLALKSHKSLHCSGVSRVDLILGNDNTAYILEVNTMPGMTNTSLVPKAAEAAGISFDLLIEIILNFADLKM